MNSSLFELSEAEKGYLAGLVDGEGCIAISKGRQSGKKRHLEFHRLIVVIAQSNEPYLEKLKQETGLGRVYGHFPKSSQWHICNKEAEIFLKLIEPYIRLKKDQVKIALDFAQTIGKEGLGFKISSELFDLRESLRIRLKATHKIPEIAG